MTEMNLNVILMLQIKINAKTVCFTLYLSLLFLPIFVIDDLVKTIHIKVKNYVT